MAKAKIMIVEDEYLVAMSAKTMLNRLGYTVTAVVKSGEKAIEQAAETHPDLVLMDIILKGARDGIEAAGQINHVLISRWFILPLIPRVPYFNGQK